MSAEPTVTQNDKALTPDVLEKITDLREALRCAAWHEAGHAVTAKALRARGVVATVDPAGGGLTTYLKQGLSASARATIGVAGALAALRFTTAVTSNVSPADARIVREAREEAGGGEAWEAERIREAERILDANETNVSAIAGWLLLTGSWSAPEQ